jgi:pyridoxine kinase
VKRTAEAGSRELLLIEAQDELVRPSEQFRAEVLGTLKERGDHVG